MLSADRLTYVGSRHDASFSLFIVFGCVNSCYSLTWDVLMDWGLLKRNSRHRLLRDELAYRHRWVRVLATSSGVYVRLNIPSMTGLLRRHRCQYTFTLLVGPALCARHQPSTRWLHHCPHRDLPPVALECGSTMAGACFDQRSCWKSHVAYTVHPNRVGACGQCGWLSCHTRRAVAICDTYGVWSAYILA